MLHQVAHAIAPTLPLSQSLSEWHQISEELADPTRRRRPQLAAYFDYLEPRGPQRLPIAA